MSNGRYIMKRDAVCSKGGLHPDYEEEIRYFKENKVFSIQIESNLSCPQGCLYCYASLENPPVQELSKKDITAILDSAVKLQVRAIDWLGGDPLVRSDWYQLMKETEKRGLKNNIWTSGIPLENKEVAQKVVEVSTGGFIAVHLDTLDEQIYQTLHKGSPHRQIQAILKGVENVQNCGKDPDEMINCITFTKPVFQDIQHTIQYFYETWGMRTCLTQMCVTGLAADHRAWVPTIQEIQKACEIRDRSNYPTSPYSFSSMDTNKYYCGNMICVTVNGDVTPCSVIRKSVGNIHDMPLEQIVQKHRDELLWVHLRRPENLPGYCSKCENNTVCWGCRAAAFYDQGDSCGTDPKCYRNRKN
ncbi:MAG TPA: radical SAM protein [Thermoplasmatales archaeon]|nr:radical SAM protein [Thermoplasmatales archaeon]